MLTHNIIRLAPRLAAVAALAVSGCVLDSVPDESELGAGARAPAGPAPGYYASADTSSPAALRASLHAIIDDHQRFPYTSSRELDTWDILEAADEDPARPGNVLDIYKNASYPKAGGGNSLYHREHSWPKSLGFPNDNAGNYPYTDCHHLFIADGEYNAERSNKPFDTCGPGCQEMVTSVNGGVGGTRGEYPGMSNWTSGFNTGGRWEVWTARRGDIARAMLYMDVRYEGGVHGVTGRAEPDLRLTDDLSLVESTGGNVAVGHLGRLSTLLAWHREDPVTPEEVRRNDIVESFQGNRNPFVDHPEWADCVFAGKCTPGGQADLWINELHYDNAGTDADEGVEIAGRAGARLDGFAIVALNGNGGGAYLTVPLSGALPDNGRGAGAVWVPIAGLQNGAPDGVALIDPSGGPVHVLGYEGSLAVASGPLAGHTAADIGVSESADTPVGASLQLTGAGCGPRAFTWTGPLSHTRGATNRGQTLDCR